MASNLRRGDRSEAARQLAPKVTQLAPGLTQSFVRQALHRAINGGGPLAPAASAAEEQLHEQGGNVDQGDPRAGSRPRAVRQRRRPGHQPRAPGHRRRRRAGQHHRPRAHPEPSGASIAHLRGYDWPIPACATPSSSPRSAPSRCRSWSSASSCRLRRWPSPRRRARPAARRHRLGRAANELISRVIGKRVATTVGKRVPVIGGAVGAHHRRLEHPARGALRQARAAPPRRPVGGERASSTAARLEALNGALGGAQAHRLARLDELALELRDAPAQRLRLVEAPRPPPAGPAGRRRRRRPPHPRRDGRDRPTFGRGSLTAQVGEIARRRHTRASPARRSSAR